MSDSKLFMLSCPHCGGKLTFDGETYRCADCLHRLTKKKAEDADAKLQETLSPAQAEEIAAVRRSLWEEANKPAPSVSAVSSSAKKLLTLVPDDMLAGFYASAVDCLSLNAFLDGLSTVKYGDDLPAVLDFSLKIMKKENLLSVKSLIDRGTSDEAKASYMAAVEAAAEKLMPGVFDTGLARDAYIIYSARDMKKVNETVVDLESRGISCFVALRNLKYSDLGAREKAQTAAANCKCAVLISTDNSRSLSGDAIRVELPYFKQFLPGKVGIEFLAAEYSKRTKDAAKNFLRDFFGGQNFCMTQEELASRIRTAGNAEQPVSAPVEPPKVSPIDALLAEGNRFLALGEFDAAYATADKVISIDDENAAGYFMMFLAEKQLAGPEDLISYPVPFDGDKTFKKALEFADGEFAELLRDYVTKNREKSEKARKDKIYKDAQTAMKDAETESDFRAVMELLERIPDYKDTEELVGMCKRKISALQSESSIALETRRFAERREAERAREAAEERRKKIKKRISTAVVALILVGAAILLWFTAIAPAIDYGKAQKLMDAGKYAEASDAFSALENYKDAALKAIECRAEIRNSAVYEEANALFAAGDYEAALEKYTNLSNYRDSKAMATKCRNQIDYQAALALYSDGSFEDALVLFRKLGTFEDSRNMATVCRNEIRYAAAMKYFNDGDYQKAKAVFEDLGSFKDSAEMVTSCEEFLSPQE